MNFAKRFFHVFALIAALMQISAHITPVLAEVMGVQQITICSGYSSRVVSIDKNGQKIPETPESLKKNCAVCALTHIAAIQPKITLIESVKHSITRVDIEPYQAVFKTAPLRAHPTRGPPPFCPKPHFLTFKT